VTLTGIAAAPGIAVGPVFVYGPLEASSADEHSTESQVSDDAALIESAAGRLVERLAENREQLREKDREETSQIFEAHEELAQDSELADAVEGESGGWRAPVRLLCEPERSSRRPSRRWRMNTCCPEIVPRLIEAGVTELSMTPPTIPRIKKKLMGEL
jgi:phosphoenolpyruvate-protein kinase (PTS system EI component)